MKIDFRNNYETIAVLSFSITFSIFTYINGHIEMVKKLPFFSIGIANFLIGLGLYLALFRILMWLYNHYLWKRLGHRDINISGYWKYKIQSDKDQGEQRLGYAVIKQNMYDLQIYGINSGSGESNSGVAMWHSSEAYISHKTLYYDYDLFGERVKRTSRLIKGRSSVELLGNPPKVLAGNYYDVPLHDDRPTTVGSVMFERIEQAELIASVKAQFDGASVLQVPIDANVVNEQSPQS